MNESERIAYVAGEYLAGRYCHITTTEIEECREAEDDLRRRDAEKRKEHRDE